MFGTLCGTLYGPPVHCNVWYTVWAAGKAAPYRCNLNGPGVRGSDLGGGGAEQAPAQSVPGQTLCPSEIWNTVTRCAKGKLMN